MWFVAFGADVQIPSGRPHVSVVQAADLRNRDDVAHRRWFDFARRACVTIEQEVRPRFVVVREVAPQDPSQVSLVEHDRAVQTLPPP
jgi:hypothetical protein